MQRILIDTDIGNDIDDALALAFALKRPELEVAAITTVRGPVVPKARLARKIVRLAGGPDVPAAGGFEGPLAVWPAATRAAYLRQPERTAGLTHGHAVTAADPEFDEAMGDDAAGVIRDTVQSAVGEVGIVTMGPLTNVAAALQRCPGIAPQIKWIAMMGGELDIHRLEHNIACDPLAAAIVFTSGVPMFLGTWSVTRRVVLGDADCRRLKEHGSPLCTALAEMIDLWWPCKGWKPGPVMYDLAPVLWAFAPSWFTTEPRRVVVEWRGDVAAGLTRAVPGEPTMDVTVDMDAEGVKALYLNTLLGDPD